MSREGYVTVEAAAELLTISPAYISRLLDAGTIPSSMIGDQRLMLLSDVVRYKQQRDEQRRRGMEELVRLSEELGLYDHEA